MKVEDNVSGLLLSEETLINILSKKYGRRVTHVETEADSLRVNFDTNEDINAFILGPEDIAKILEKHYGRKILDFDTKQHEEYLIRFHV